MREIPKSPAMVLVVLFTALCPGLLASPRLVLSTTSVQPSPIAPGSIGPVQYVEALNAGDGALNLTATSSASWLSATVGAAKACTILTGTCNPINVTLSTASLAAGSYTEFITLNDPNAIDTPQQIAVTITIAGVPNSVTLYAAPPGTGHPTALAYIYPASAVTGVATTQSGGNWLSFTPAGDFFVQLPNIIQASAQPGQAPGTYTGSVVISGSTLPSDNKTIAVTLIVTAAPILDLSGISTIEFFGYQGGDKPYSSSVTFPNLGAGVLNITGAASSASFLTVAVSGSNTISIAADPSALTTGLYNATVTTASNAANNSLVSIPVEFVVYPAGPNVISAASILNEVTYAVESLAPGDVVAVFGTQLAAPGISATNPGPPPLAKTLGNVQVLVNGSPVPLYYVSSKQINFQVPYSLTAGQVATVQVVSGGTPGNQRSITIAASVPRMILYSGNYAAAVNYSDGSLPFPPSVVIPPYISHPAKPGDILVFYGIGFGQTSPAAQEGNPASTSPLQYAATTNVTFGNVFAGPPVTVTAAFAGLSSPGLYQVNVVVPANVPFSNALPVTVTVGGAPGNTVNIAVSANGQ